MAATTMLVAATVTHGVLRPALEARGIKPWRVRDTLASAPLICLGSAGVGGGAGLIALGIVRLETPLLAQATALTLGAGVVLVSALVLLLGVIALRKLH